MIGPGWADDRGAPARATPSRLCRVAVVTGSRADFGLLTPVMRAIDERPELELLVIAAGAHLIPPATTFRDVKALFPVADSVPMQTAGRHTRFDDAEAVGKGIARFARSFAGLQPDWVVVLGDRIEAFAAASAAAIGGWALAHIHGGDRAPGVADEQMRHAITKLAHLHLAATDESAQRIIRMGETPDRVHVVGSPAIDTLEPIPPLDDDAFDALGAPDLLLLMHPIGRSDEQEEHAAAEALGAMCDAGGRILALHPNTDPGRRGVLRAIEASGAPAVEHLERARFVGLLKRMVAAGGVLVGNSSAGLIEAPALGLRVVDVGARQQGRQRPQSVISAAEQRSAIVAAISAARRAEPGPAGLYGDGHAAERASALLAQVDPHSAALLTKLCAD
ncbi:MAG: UDP-N-acetylglucosamine 2-epimerase [Phycisphaerales bacterium JB039]